MALSKYGGNARDGNEAVIFAAWRSVGASVFPIDLPGDVLVGYRKKTFLFEIKKPLGPRGGTSHSRQTQKQREFEMQWRGQYRVIRTVGEALAAIGAVR